MDVRTDGQWAGRLQIMMRKLLCAQKLQRRGIFYLIFTRSSSITSLEKNPFDIELKAKIYIFKAFQINYLSMTSISKANHYKELLNIHTLFMVLMNKIYAPYEYLLCYQSSTVQKVFLVMAQDILQVGAHVDTVVYRCLNRQIDRLINIYIYIYIDRQIDIQIYKYIKRKTIIETQIVVYLR